MSTTYELRPGGPTLRSGTTPAEREIRFLAIERDEAERAGDTARAGELTRRIEQLRKAGQR